MGTVTGTSSPVVWESWLSSVEGDAARAFDQFDKGGVRSLDQEALAHLGFFISVQATRSRFHRYQAGWNASVGVYRALQLDEPGAIAAQLKNVGEDPTPERVAEVAAYFGRINANPRQMKLSAAFEMDLMQRSAFGFNELLTTRNFKVYQTDKPRLIGDEPVVALWERMGEDHLQDGGWFGTPIIAFPMDPHHVAAFFRSNMPPMRVTDAPLDWRETLELNRTIAGNSFRNAVSQPSNVLALKLLVPEAKEPMQMQNYVSPDGLELIRWRTVRRWTDEAHAPIRPVASWWPAAVPPAPTGPLTKAEWDEEKRKWDNI